MKLTEKTEYLRTYDGRPLRLMEVCGTHTAGIWKSGIRSFLSPKIRLVSGPGCPVCVTPTAYIDKCVEYAGTDGFALVSFGDMLKVPGSGMSLDRARGLGARVEFVYAPFDVLAMAEREPGTHFVVAAVGFETTVPAYALLMDELIGRRLGNVQLLTALKSALPAIDWVCGQGVGAGCGERDSGDPADAGSAATGSAADIDGFLCPGHVSVITGARAYAPLAEKYGKPFVVAGFEEAHLVDAIYELVRLAEKNNPSFQASAPAGARDPESPRNLVANRYPEAVSDGGNGKARAATDRYFDRGAAVWRGLGPIAASGFYLKPQYVEFDAGSRALTRDAALPEGCRCADVITGRLDPDGCPLFGGACTPEHARGPCMVSAEGACGVWLGELHA